MEIPKMRAVTLDAFVQLFDPTVHAKIREIVSRPSVEGIVCFTNLNEDSSECGSRTAVIYGPDRAYKTLEELERTVLGNSPARRQHPTHAYVKPSLETAA